MNRRHAIWTALAALHLGLVAFCSAGLMPSFDNIPGQALRWYGSMSGATNRYGFFKEVGTGCKVTFLLTDRSGRTWTDTLNQAGNREAEMRANGSLYMIHDLGHSLAASWAATMFARHPEAAQVVVQFEQYDPPTMGDYAAGQRPEWNTSYVALFVRQKDAVTE